MLQNVRRVEKQRNQGDKKTKESKAEEDSIAVPVARPDESLAEYSRRVDAAFRERLQQETRKTIKTSDRRKKCARDSR